MKTSINYTQSAMDKLTFYVVDIWGGKTLVHSEIVKVVKKTTQPMSTFHFRTLILETLFAKDSMSSYSSVRPIRERLKETKERLTYNVREGGSLAEYDKQVAARSKHSGYLFEEQILDYYIV